MAAHAYWRINIYQVGTGPNAAGNGSPGLAECVFYDNTNTPISTSGGTATSNAGFNPFVAGGGSPASAFDGNTATSWCSTGTATLGSPVYIQMQFLSPVAVDHFKLTYTDSIPAAAPFQFDLSYSDTGAPGSFTLVYTYIGAIWQGNTTYSGTFYTTGNVYRLTVNTIAGGGSTGPARPVWSNVKLFDSTNTLLTGVGGNGLASSWDGGAIAGSDPANPTQGYNNGCSQWFANNPTAWASAVQWVGFQFPTAVTVASLSLQSANFIDGPNDTPVTFSIGVSTDGLNFTTINSFTSVTWTGTCQTQTFSVIPPLAISCNNPPSGREGVLYSHSFPATGGVPPYGFAITSGSLPPGLNLNASTGIVSGTPTTPGNYSFTVTVTDSN